MRLTDEPTQTKLPRLVVTVIVVLFSAFSDSAEKVPKMFDVSPPQWTLEVESYGEEQRDLNELFVPFFARLYFASGRRHVDDANVSFSGPSGDVITAAGRFNCVVFRYYGYIFMWERADNSDLRRRADNLRLEMNQFVATLPEPRPTVKELDLRDKFCGRTH